LRPAHNRPRAQTAAFAPRESPASRRHCDRRGSGNVECYLIEESDTAAFKLKARRRLFAFEADDLMALGNWRFRPASPPDIWYNMVVTTLTLHLDSHA
jgi:hypothetical protein